MNHSTLLLEKVNHYARAQVNSDGMVCTPVPGLSLMCIERPGERVQSNYRPLVCLVLQGAKHLVVGSQELVCSNGQSVIVSADMPVTGQVIEASATAPYLALAMELDMALLSEQAEQLGSSRQVATESARATLFAQPTEAAVLDCGRRFLELMESPEAIPFLFGGLLKELQYRLLTGPNSEVLRVSVAAHSTATRLAPSIALLQKQFREALEIERLADAAAMSRAAFHRHFKALTSLTPVQYQKRLRLLEARRLLRHEAASATRAAYEVGYESVPQFTRDYGSMFGMTPGRERLSLAA